MLIDIGQWRLSRACVLLYTSNGVRGIPSFDVPDTCHHDDCNAITLSSLANALRVTFTTALANTASNCYTLVTSVSELGNALQEISTGLQQLHGRLQAIQAEVLEQRVEPTGCTAGLISLSTAGILMAASQVSFALTWPRM